MPRGIRTRPQRNRLFHPDALRKGGVQRELCRASNIDGAPLLNADKIRLELENCRNAAECNVNTAGSPPSGDGIPTERG